MVILAIDSSAPSASAAVISDGKVLSEMYLNVGLTHSATLMPLIHKACDGAGVTVSDLDALAVTNGPGSFTGVRIGVATVKGIAQPGNLPCVPVSALEAAAYPLAGSGCTAAAVMDARCSQVYTALFDCAGGSFSRLTNDSALSLRELCETLSEYNSDIVLIGDGADVSYEYLKDKLPRISKASGGVRYQSASSVGLLAQRKLLSGKTAVPPDKLIPSYLRLPQAERELKRKKETTLK